MSLLKTTNLGISFGGLRAVDDVNIEINDGELVGLIGPNGAGKTTIFNLLTGVYKPTDGDISINNNIIKIWDSMVDIEKELNISSGKICMCCKGKRKTTGGFKFEYYEK